MTTRAEQEGFPKDMRKAAKQIAKAVCDANDELYTDGFAAGLQEGARRERSRLRILALRYPDASLYILLTGAPKASRKRKGGTSK